MGLGLGLGLGLESGLELGAGLELGLGLGPGRASGVGAHWKGAVANAGMRRSSRPGPSSSRCASLAPALATSHAVRVCATCAAAGVRGELGVRVGVRWG